MATAKIINDILKNDIKEVEVTDCKTVKDIIEKYVNKDVYIEQYVECYDPETDKTSFIPLEDDTTDTLSLAVAINNKPADIDSEINEDDIIAVIVLPSGGTRFSSWEGWKSTIINAGKIALGMAVIAFTMNTTAFFGLNGWDLIASGIRGINEYGEKSGGSSTSGLEGESALGVRGAQNQSLVGNSFPVVIGKHLTTPFICGSPYSTAIGEYGINQEIRVLYAVGYAPLKLTNFKMDSRVLAHNEKWAKNANLTTVMHGKISGVLDNDQGEITNAFYNNDIEIEILQQDPNSDVDYGTIYPEAVIETQVNASPLFIADKDLDKVLQTKYKGSRFPRYFRNNSVRLSQSCPRKIAVELDAQSGLYATKNVNNDGNSSQKYWAIPIWYAVQYRIYSSKNESSDAENGSGWVSFTELNGDTNHPLTARLFTEDERIADLDAHAGNTFNADKKATLNKGWVGSYLFNFADAYDKDNDENNVSEMRFTGYVNFTLNECKKMLETENPSNIVEVRVIRVSPCYFDETASRGNSGPTSFQDLIQWNTLTTWKFDKDAVEKLESTTSQESYRYEVLKETWNRTFKNDEWSDYYCVNKQWVTINPKEASSYEDKIANKYKDQFDYEVHTVQVGYGTITCGSYDNYYDEDHSGYASYYTYTSIKKVNIGTTEEVPALRPISEEKMRKLCVVALKAKADTGGNIKGQLKKLSVIAESFQPYVDLDTKKIFPANISKKTEYYYPNYYDEISKSWKKGERITASSEKEEKAIYESLRLKGKDANCYKKGNDYLETIDNLIFKEEFKDAKGRYFLNPDENSQIRKCNENNAISSALYWLVGPHAGVDARGYEDIDIISAIEAFEDCNVIKDGSVYNKDTIDSDGSSHKKGEEVAIKYSANAWIYQQTKAETVLANILTAGRCMFARNEYNQIQFLFDKEEDFPTMIVNQQNCISSSVMYSYEETPSGLVMRYSDETDEFDTNTIYCMEDAEDPENPQKYMEQYQVPYATNPKQVWSLGRYILASRVLNKKIVSAKVGWEGFNAELLGTAVVQLPVLLLGTDFGGRIQRLIEDDDYIYGFICNEMFHFTGETETIDGAVRNRQGVEIFQPIKQNKSNCVCLRLALEGTKIPVNETGLDGNAETVLYTAEKGQTNVVLFEKKISKADESLEGEASDILYYKPQIDNIVNFGYIGSISETYKVTKIKADKDFNYDLTLTFYSPEIYKYGKALPAFQNNMTIPDRSGETYNLSNDLTPDILASKINGNALVMAENISKLLTTGQASGNPSVPTGLYGYAQKDNILLKCNPPDLNNASNKLEQTVSCYVWYINKGDYEEVGRTTASSFSYNFNRTTDGFPEKDQISPWKIAVKCINIYGKESELATASIDVSGYGTWIFGTPKNINAIADENGIDISWNVDYEKNMYGSLKYTARVYYDDQLINEYVTTNLNYSYKFNRAVDKYPEKQAVYDNLDKEAYSKTTSLGKYTIAISAKNIESGTVQNGDDTSVTDIYYKTWIPEVSTPLVIARKENLGIIWNRQNNLYGNEVFNLSVKHGDFQKNINSIVSSSYNYTFSRVTDGYPEAVEFSDWEVGVVHSNGVYSTEKTTAPIDTSSYGTWKPAAPNSVIITAQKENLSLTWDINDTEREFYGDLRYRVVLNHGTQQRLSKNIKEKKYEYVFNRSLDKYPELKGIYDEIKSICPNATDLSLYNCTVTSFDSLSGNESEAVENSTIDTSSYKTWTVPQVSATSLTANKEGLKSTWDITSDLTFGDIKYKTEFLYDTQVIKTIAQAVEKNADYTFDRDFDKDGFPEKKSVLDALKEHGITSKGRCLDLYKISITAFTVQCPQYVTSSKMDCSLRGYGTWVPDYSNNSLAAVAGQNGISSEIITYPSMEEYGLPYSFEFGIKKGDDDNWITRTSDSSKFDYTFENEFPEADELSKWKIRCRPVSTAGVPALYYTSRSPDITSYGTWKLEKPNVATRVSDRTITLVISLPSSSVVQYGNIRYRIKIRKPGYDPEDVWFKPGRELDPYTSEDNYKSGTGYIETGNVYTQTMPLTGQGAKSLIDTQYQFSVTAVNEAGESSSNEEIFATALCTNIRDIVHANETAKEAYITKLSAISANVGTIKEGSLSGNDKNYWNLSTFRDEETGMKRWQGAMRVGGEDQYLLVEPQIKNDSIAGYNITFKVGNFEISSQASNINGELIIIRDSTSLDRTRITPDGTFYEHRETLQSEWFSIAQMTTQGILANALISERSLIVTNMSIQERRRLGHDVGRTYLSSNSRVWHFDTDLNDQNQETDLIISKSGELELVGSHTKGNIDFTSAILAVAPYSEVANSLYGQYQLVKNISATNNMTADFWIQYIWCENQILFEAGTKEDRVKLVVQQNEEYWNTPNENEPMWNAEAGMAGDVIVWNEPAEASTSIYHIGETNPIPDENNTKTFKQLGIKFESNSWLHIGIILTEDEIAVYLDKIKISFARFQTLKSDIDIILNRFGDELKNSFILDELFIDETVCENFEDFARNTDARIPWGTLDYKQKHFILDADGLVTNIFDSKK